MRQSLQNIGRRSLPTGSHRYPPVYRYASSARRRPWPGERRWLCRCRVNPLALLRLALLLILAVLVFNFLNARLKPLMWTYTVNQAKTVVTRAVNEAVQQVLKKEEVQYTDLIEVVKNADGEIVALESNAVKVNLLKAEITTTVLDTLEKQNHQTFGVPLGTLIGGEMLSGRGPTIPVKVAITATAQTNLHSSFESAGINQTSHQLTMQVDMQLYPAIPGHEETVDIHTEILIAESVLVGEVPNAVIGKL